MVLQMVLQMVLDYRNLKSKSQYLEARTEDNLLPTAGAAAAAAAGAAGARPGTTKPYVGDCTIRSAHT
jgi:hypothetical protein